MLGALFRRIFFCIKNERLLRLHLGCMNNVWVFFIGNAIFLFPICVSVYSIASDKEKFVFSACLFSIPILGGYITRDKLKFFIHITKNRAILFDLGKFIKERKKMFKIKGITPLQCRTTIKIGMQNKLINTVPELFLSAQTVPCVINDKKPYFKIKTDFTVCKNDELFIYNKFSFVFNLLSLNAMLFNSLLKKAVKKFERKKSCG